MGTASFFNRSNAYTFLKHIGNFQEYSMTLRPSFSKPGSTLLVGKLNGTKGGLKAIDKEHLNIFFINSWIYLVKDFNEEIISEVICRPDNMNPGGFSLRVRL